MLKFEAGTRVYNLVVYCWGTVLRPGSVDGWYVVLSDAGYLVQWLEDNMR